MRQYVRLAILGLCALSLFLVGCGSNNGPAAGRGRAINALLDPTTPAINVLFNGVAVTPGQGLTFSAISSSFSEPAGTNTVDVQTAATPPVPIITGAAVPVTSSIDQLFLVNGHESSVSGSDQPEFTALGRTDLSTDSIPTSQQARIYFINAVPASAGGTIDFTYTDAIVGPVDVKVPYPAMSPEQIVASGSIAFSAKVNGEMLSSTFPITGKTVYAIMLTGNTAASGKSPGLSLAIFQLT